MGKQIEKGLALHRAGRLAEAEAIYAGICRRDRDDAAAAYLLGVARLGLRRDVDALSPLRRAATLEPTNANAFGALGEVCDRLGRPEEAIEAYRRAVALQPNDPSLRLNLAAARLASFDAGGALAECDAALAAQPGLAAAHANAALALKMLGRFEAAKARFQQALALAPDDAGTLFNFGNLLGQQGAAAEAEEPLRRALTLQPGFTPAKLALAHAMRETARTDMALTLIDEVLAAEPDHPIATVWRCMLQLPVVYTHAEEVASRRGAYQASLDMMEQAVAKQPARYLPGIASTRPFFLAYQGEDDRALQTRYGAMVHRIVSANISVPTRQKRSREKIRIGIVCGYFRHHSVWKLPTRGWLIGLDRSRFEIVGYHTSGETDTETETAAQTLTDRFVQGPMSLTAWVGRIVEDACDVLLYPEIGMDPMCVQLAALRLAPVQGNGLGHPVTSGLPTIDLALTSALMEPDGAEAHYTEQLVRLPNLGVGYDYLALPEASATRPELGIPANAFAFWCGQSLFKYQPRFDGTFAQIARGAPDSRFVFIGFQSGDAVTEVFRRRLDHTFAAQGLASDAFCIFLPRLSSASFVAAAACCDAILDSLGWSGFNSTLESLAHDLPVVTWDGPFMRGRHSAAVLRRLGLEDTIADTEDAFVAAAVRVATDAAWRRDLAARIAAAKPRLFGDKAATDALGDVLEAALRDATPSRLSKAATGG